jgi:hypothetical protein
VQGEVGSEHESDRGQASTHQRCNPSNALSEVIRQQVKTAHLPAALHLRSLVQEHSLQPWVPCQKCCQELAVTTSNIHHAIKSARGVWTRIIKLWARGRGR